MDNTRRHWSEFSTSKQSCIKEEAFESPFPSFPPSSPSSAITPTPSCGPSSTASLANLKRVQPYTPFKRETSGQEELGIMSLTQGCGTWSHSNTRSGSGRLHTSTQRQSSDSEDTSYPLGHQPISDPFVDHIYDTSALGQPSSSSNLTSSLTGAMGDTTITSHSRQSRSPPSHNDNSYSGSGWVANSQMHTQLSHEVHNPPFSGLPALESTMTFQNIMPQELSTNGLPFNELNPTVIRNVSSDLVPTFGQSIYNDQYSAHTSRGHFPLHIRNPGYPATSIPQTPFHCTPESPNPRLEAEIVHLHRRIHDLEAECARARNALEARGSHTSSIYGGLPTPHATPPQTSTFQSSWRARTEARKRMFCSLNRAGNALCAWHDSRRERRAFPPRNAPPGYLNCGCTYEEALFEESLSRHNVGSYHPGETVRMDPALRNPLLKLLQERYGYQDGDFERDPITGDWVEGEGSAYWEQQAHSGASARRRVDAERH